MSKKRGALSREEKNFITRNVHDMDVDEIAVILGRTEKPIRKYIEDNNLLIHNQAEESELEILIKKLHLKPYWQEIKQQYTEEELKYWAMTWANLMLQFREDVLYAEELSICKFIELEVYMSRAAKERLRHVQQETEIQELIDAQMELPEGSRDQMLLNDLKIQQVHLKTAIGAFTKEQATLLDKRKDLEKSLKANRDERIKRVEDGQNSWGDFLKWIADDKEREMLGKEAEIMAMATEKALKDLGQDHEYSDGAIDKPLLTVDTVQGETDG